MLVEEELVVRGMVVEVMEGRGCRFIEAADGPSGLVLVLKRRQIDLLISDVGLPGLTGRQLADWRGSAGSGLKVLFMTGYAENTMFGDGYLEAGMEMITSPFSVETFMRRVRAIIDRWI